MTKINGIELKGLQTHRGHEGELLNQGTIYKDGQKIGFYSDGDWGGPNDIDLVSGVKMTQEEIDELELIIFQVIDLKEKEKFYKAGLKKGFDAIAIIAVSSYEERCYQIRYEKHKYQIIALALKDGLSEESVTFYKSLEDFNITTEISQSA